MKKLFLHLGGPKDGQHDYVDHESDYFSYNSARGYGSYYWQNIRKIGVNPPKSVMIHKSFFKKESE